MTSCRPASVILLVYNEVDGVRSLIQALRSIDAAEVFAMDGGSTDGTVEALREGGIAVHKQTRPGRGPALVEGVERAGQEIVVIFSPDGNEDAADIPILIDSVSQGADLAIASRFLPASRNEEDDELFPFRAWANRSFTLIANALWNRRETVTDTINGFRAFRRARILSLALDAPGMTIEYQMTIRAMKMGLAVREIPTREGNRIGGETHAPSIPTGLAFLRLLGREILAGRAFGSPAKEVAA